MTLFQRDRLATGANRQSVLSFATHDATRHRRRLPTHVADLTLVNFVITPHMAIMFC